LPNVCRNTGVAGTVVPSLASSRTLPMSTRIVCVPSLRSMPVNTRSPGIVGWVNTWLSPVQPSGPTRPCVPTLATAITATAASVAMPIMATARRPSASARVCGGAVVMKVLN
jgi:hypothetical protein